MPRKLLLILFCFCLTCVYAQARYKKCTVYTTKPGSNSDSFVSKVQHFNRYGKITEEHHYVRDTGNSPRAEYITYYTYTKDTLLTFRKTICYGNEDRCLDDTAIAIYLYNSDNKPLNTISASYGRGGSGCMVGILGTRWYDSTKTEYHYDKKGSLTHVATSDISLNFPTGFTMGFSPNFRSYGYDDKNRMISIRHLHVHSLDDFGREFIKKHGYSDTTQLAKEVFAYHDKAYTVDLVGTDYVDRPVHNTSYFFYDQSDRVIQEYIHDPYLSGWYDDPVERFYSYRPDKRLVKEILYNNTGQVDRVNNYIYE